MGNDKNLKEMGIEISRLRGLIDDLIIALISCELRIEEPRLLELMEEPLVEIRKFDPEGSALDRQILSALPKNGNLFDLLEFGGDIEKRALELIMRGLSDDENFYRIRINLQNHRELLPNLIYKMVGVYAEQYCPKKV